MFFHNNLKKLKIIHIFSKIVFNNNRKKEQKVKTAFFKLGQTKIELLESTSDDSSVAKFIEKRGEGLHHLAFAVNNVDKSLQEAKSKGIKLIDNSPRKGAEGLNIAFLHPKSTFGVLTEFCSK